MSEGTPLELNNLDIPEKARPLSAVVINHIRENVDLMSDEFQRLGEGRADRWSGAPDQLGLLAGEIRSAFAMTEPAGGVAG